MLLQSQPKNFVCYGYGASRRLGGSGLGEKFNHPRPCDSLFDDEAALTNAEEWLLQADYAVLKSPDDEAAQRRFSLVKNVLLTVLPGVGEVKAIAPPGFGQPAHVEVEHEGVRVPLRSLSSGYRSVLVWMVDLATRMLARYPDAENPLAEPAIVLVDQIDLHLHPKWQRSLIGTLSKTFPDTQFIVTAHSALIVQAAEEAGANVAVLEREGDYVRIKQDVASVRGWRVDQILTSELFDELPSRAAAIEELLKKRRALLAKPRLTARDGARLAALEAEIGPLPTGESREDIEARLLIRQAADELRRQRGEPTRAATRQGTVAA